MKALYDCSKGIIDQLIGVYMYMQIDYIRARRKPAVNADYVRKTAEKHYPGVQKILQQIEDPANERKRAELAKEAQSSMEQMLQSSKTQAAINAIKAMDSTPETADITAMKSNVTNSILKVTSSYTQESIEQVFGKVISSKAGKAVLSDEMALTQMVFAKLMKQKTDLRPRSKKASKSERDAKIRNYLQDDSEDDLL